MARPCFIAITTDVANSRSSVKVAVSNCSLIAPITADYFVVKHPHMEVAKRKQVVPEPLATVVPACLFGSQSLAKSFVFLFVFLVFKIYRL